LDTGEPQRVAQAVQSLNLNYVVVTSVTRDDLDDGGAKHFADTIIAVRKVCPDTKVEVLVPDFKGSLAALKAVCRVKPDMFNHNIETVPRLYSIARPQASFQRSLNVLEYVSGQGLRVKSGLMLGMGEIAEEVVETLLVMLDAGCEYLTLGQYLSPSNEHVRVARYVQPQEFEMWGNKARAMGFKDVAAGPLIRSSYKAETMLANQKAQSDKIQFNIQNG
jgi:lipoic acid synthetase